jgi:hypothetical protein
VKLIYNLVIVSLLLTGGICLSLAEFTRHNFIVVEKAGEVIELKVGDMIEMASPMLPLVPANLDKEFQVTYDQKTLRLIGDLTPDVEGVMGREYYFKAIFPGDGFIEITVSDAEGEVLEKHSQDILVKK